MNTSDKSIYLLLSRMDKSKNGIVKPNIRNSTVERIEENIGRPVTHGVDKALNECLDQLDELKNNHTNKLDCLCPETKEVAAQNG